VVPLEKQFLIRQSEAGDLAGIYRLARHLDSYNLPADKKQLRRLLEISQKSFAGKFKDPARGRYLFVLEELPKRKLAGCSLIIAKHGTPGLPHIFMDSFVEKRHSRTLGKTVNHRCLRLGWTEDGPTEAGGLVVLPEYRGRPEKLGHWLSYVRFLYMAAHRRNFQTRVLVEFLPAFAKKGQSPLWDYFGKKFTGLSYSQADRLSIDNKEFILSLFPTSTLYLDLFPEDVVRHLGRVGDPTRPASRILEKIGFRYLHQIEPFDGGPYYGAEVSSISLVRRARKRRWRPAEDAVSGKVYLLLSETAQGARCLAERAQERNGTLAISRQAAELLNLTPGARVWAVPFS